jgi:hypothetical protein
MMIREKLSVSKPIRKSNIKRFHFKELMMQRLRNSIRSKSQTRLQLWKTWMIMWTTIGLGKILRRISNFQSKRMQVII